MELISKQPYDLIVSDLMMPGMSGIDFVREIGSFEKDYKVVLMTGHADVDTFIESVYGLGALEYIVKPIDGKRVRSLVKLLCPLDRKLLLSGSLLWGLRRSQQSVRFLNVQVIQVH